QMLDGKNVGVDLVAHLQEIAAIDEDRGAVGEHDCRAGRAGEAGEPSEPLFRWRQVFVLETVGARHDEAVQAAAFELGAQRGDTRRAGGAFGRILERLEFGFEHGRAIYGSLWIEATATRFRAPHRCRARWPS